jgi:signal transduction histidine kinase
VLKFVSYASFRSLSNSLFFNIRGEGDLHDRSFEKYRRSRVLTSLDGETLFSDMSAVYTLTLLYPTKKLFNVYSTTNPAVATAGAVLIVMFTSFVFLLYDLFVRKAFNEKDSALNAKRQFMCFVSHEVRTPLNSVCMGLKFMQEEIEDGAPPDTPGGALVPSSNDSHTNEARQDPGMTGQQVQEMKKLIEEILGNAESAVDVLNDFLNYDKIEMGKLSLELTIIPIWTLVEKTMLEFNIAAESKSINFKLDLSRLMDLPHQVDASTLPRDVQECRVVGDAIRITQVLRNIISNGLKFTPEGGKHHELKFTTWEDYNIRANTVLYTLGSLTITVSMVACTSSSKKTGAKQPEQKFISNDDEEVSFEERGVVRIDVKDTGAGLSVEQSKKLFMDGVRFNVNKLQAGKGSGLGLYIAKGIAEQHGGTLKASSEGLGMGTTFTLLIPLFHIPDMALPVCFKHLRLERTKSECALKLEEGNHEHKIESLRILVVDDSVSNRK